MTAETGIAGLIGEAMSAVAFVHDYVEFHFDGAILRSLTNPAITIGCATILFPAEGSRDALCRMIGKTVVNVTVLEGERIDLEFEDGALIAVPLGNSKRRGPEAAHYVPGANQPIEVW